MKASERVAALPAIDPARVPRHVAIIMDGNGRWARERGLPRMEGDRAVREAVAAEAEELVKNGIRLRISGDLDRLPPEIAAQLRDVMARTRHNDRLVLNFALNYGGRAELLQAVRRLARDVANGLLTPEAIDDARFSRYLYTDGLPDPDLLIRTGGEQRISNFLLWQIAYTELYFCEVYWPDFGAVHLHEAVQAYQSRRRRFGGVDDG